MVKYDKKSTMVCSREIPDYISLGISITNCQGRCEGCHSPWLREDIGEELTSVKLEELINANKGINCVIFMGEGNDHLGILQLAEFVRKKFPELKIAVYSGREQVEEDYFDVFDFVKIGPYIAKHGALDCRTTNQRLLEVDREHGMKKDITSRFWINH